MIIQGLFINIPSGATVLVNIHNTTAVISGGNMTVNSLGAPSNFGAGANVLFNFKEATALNLNAFALLGSVLAPNATLTATGGSINGQAIIGGNVSMLDGFEFHNFEFTGNIPAALLPVSLIDFYRNTYKQNHKTKLVNSARNEYGLF
ncbi:MAG: choice-of-anchor A family protein [Ferruginibacter sp.]